VPSCSHLLLLLLENVQAPLFQVCLLLALLPGLCCWYCVVVLQVPGTGSAACLVSGPS
jgi:hypothetical protein